MLCLVFGFIGCEKVSETPKKAVQTCRCYQSQHLVFETNGIFDTLLIWETDTVTLDSMSVHYGFLYCGIDTIDPAGEIFNRMKCDNF